MSRRPSIARRLVALLALSALALLATSVAEAQVSIRTSGDVLHCMQCPPARYAPVPRPDAVSSSSVDAALPMRTLWRRASTPRRVRARISVATIGNGAAIAPRTCASIRSVSRASVRAVRRPPTSSTTSCRTVATTPSSGPRRTTSRSAARITTRRRPARMAASAIVAARSQMTGRARASERADCHRAAARPLASTRSCQARDRARSRRSPGGRGEKISGVAASATACPSPRARPQVFGKAPGGLSVRTA